MKKLRLLLSICLLLAVLACTNSSKQESRVMSMAEVHQTLESGKDIQLLDVRTAEEFNEGHVAGAMNVSVTDEGFEEGVVSLNKEKPIYVYCRSGKRSAKAAEILSELGFKVIYDVEGGITAWRNAGFPTEN